MSTCSHWEWGEFEATSESSSGAAMMTSFDRMFFFHQGAEPPEREAAESDSWLYWTQWVSLFLCFSWEGLICVDLSRCVSFPPSLHCVQGCYPPEFLKAWDAFDKRKGSENDRPGLFKVIAIMLLKSKDFRFCCNWLMNRNEKYISPFKSAEKPFEDQHLF